MFTGIYVNAQDYRFGKVSVEEVAQKQHPVDPDAHAAILYREYKTDFQYAEDDGFYLMTEVFERVKIYDKEGFDWANKVVELYQTAGSQDEELTGLKGYTYSLDSNGKLEETKLKRDGIFDEEVSKYMELKKFTMPNVSEGCVIEYQYTIKSPFYSNIDAFRFQESIPVEKSEMRFVSPEYFSFKTHSRGWIPFNILTEGKTRTMTYRYTVPANPSIRGGRAVPSTQTTNVTFKEDVYTVSMENVPGVKEEKYAGNIDNFMSSLKFELSYTKFPSSNINSYTTNWEAVSKSIYDSPSFGDQLSTKNFFKKDIDALLSGISNPETKMIKIFEFVKAKMAWNGYTGFYANEGVKDAYKKGTGNVGDINLMLTAMLRYAGLNANPILISTKNHGVPIFPTRNGFNYVIAGVEIPNGVLLLDASDKFSEVGILSEKLLNWQGRIIREEGSSAWVPLVPTKPATESVMLNATLNSDQSLEGDLQCRFSGHYAMRHRETYHNLDDESKRMLLEKDKGETELSEIAFENLKKLYIPVNLSYSFKTTDAVEEIGDKLYLSPMLFLALKESPFQMEERQYPVDFQYPMKDRYIINITIPEGYVVETIPEAIAYSLGENEGSFKYVANQRGAIIQVSTEFTISQALISSEKYGDLKKFYQLIIDKQNEKIVLSKT